MTTLELSSSARLRAVASQMRTEGTAVERMTAVLLDRAADGYDSMVAATTASIRGIDSPPELFFGNPDAAYAHADAQFFDELALARVWADTRPTGTGGAR